MNETDRPFGQGLLDEAAAEVCAVMDTHPDDPDDRRACRSAVSAVLRVYESSSKSKEHPVGHTSDQEPVVVIAFDVDAATRHCREEGLVPNRCGLFSTNYGGSAAQLDGKKVRPENVRWVDGWRDGRYADQIERVMARNFTKSDPEAIQ